MKANEKFKVGDRVQQSSRLGYVTACTSRSITVKFPYSTVKIIAPNFDVIDLYHYPNRS
jgi:small-conductance mechanosensitive channel